MALIDPAILRAMQAAGASTDVIIAAVEAAAALDEAKADERRAKDAERQRRHRASRDVTVTERDSVTAPTLSRPPNENNSNPPTHTHPDMTSRPRKADPFPRPLWADPQHWADFLQNRKRKKLANTASAYTKFLADIARHSDDDWPPGRILEHAAAHGWAGIYDPREKQNGRLPTNQNDSRGVRGSRPDPALDMLYAAQRDLQAEAFGQDTGLGGPAWPALPAN